MPTWAAFGCQISMLPVPHECYTKEFPDENEVNNMSKITHLFYGKYMTIEAVRKKR